MKAIIIGLHDSGKSEVRKQLKEWGFNGCKKFSSDPDAYEEYYTSNELKEVFENQIHLFIDTFYDAPGLYVGATIRDYEACDFITMTPREMMKIPANRELGDIVVLWMDNTRKARLERWKDKDKHGDFNLQEQFDCQGMHNLTDFLYKFPHVLYFNNEDPSRVAAIAAAVIKHPSLVDIFAKSFK